MGTKSRNGGTWKVYAHVFEGLQATKSAHVPYLHNFVNGHGDQLIGVEC